MFSFVRGSILSGLFALPLGVISRLFSVIVPPPGHLLYIYNPAGT